MMVDRLFINTDSYVCHESPHVTTFVFEGFFCVFVSPSYFSMNHDALLPICRRHRYQRDPS